MHSEEAPSAFLFHTGTTPQVVPKRAFQESDVARVRALLRERVKRVHPLKAPTLGRDADDEEQQEAAGHQDGDRAHVLERARLLERLPQIVGLQRQPIGVLVALLAIRACMGR